jgi:alkanesulfonate monooxygenase SsuD/methylene tetrahydromethanopterin reductase-like flavin-dependent oxidoreductase (luciferase family)
VEYGVALPTGGACGDPNFLLELAVLAEQTGWDGVFLEDYICYQGDPSNPTCDTWAVLAAIAVRTRRVVLGTEVRRSLDRRAVEWIEPAERETMCTAVERGPLRVD